MDDVGLGWRIGGGAGVSVLIVVVLFVIAPITVAYGFRSIILNDLLRVDVF